MAPRPPAAGGPAVKGEVNISDSNDLTVPMVTTESWPQQVEDLEKSSYSSSVGHSRPGKLDKLNCPSHRSSSISGLSPVVSHHYCYCGEVVR